jgi:hypothetical protein
MMPHALGPGLRCPTCNGETSVRDSRPSGNMVRRRRLCAECGHRFSTFEAFVEEHEPLLAYRAIRLRAQIDGLSDEQRETVEKLITLLSGKPPPTSDDSPEIPNLSAT